MDMEIRCRVYEVWEAGNRFPHRVMAGIESLPPHLNLHLARVQQEAAVMIAVWDCILASGDKGKVK